MRPSANTSLMLRLPDTPTALPDWSSTEPEEEHAYEPDEVPSQNSLRRLANYPLYDTTGNATTLSALFSPTCLRKTRMLLIFVRNFFCGNCQQFLLTLAEQLPPSALPADTSIAIIGCGAASLLESYMELTHCPYPIYTDPSTELYTKLGMTRTLKMGDTAPEYIKEGLFLSGLKSIMQGLKRLPEGDVRKAGDMNLNGGEFLFERRPGSVGWGGDRWAEDWYVDWCHRMRNTRDHTEVRRLREILGIDRKARTGRTGTWSAGTKQTWLQRQRQRAHTVPSVEKSHKRGHSIAKALKRMPSLNLKRPGTGKSSKNSADLHEEEMPPPPPTTIAMAAWERPDELKDGGTRARSHSKSKNIMNLRLPMATAHATKGDQVALFSVVTPSRASIRSSLTPEVGSPWGGTTPLFASEAHMNVIAVR